MFCPNCAAQYSQGLKYCKQCGTHLGEGAQPAKSDPSAPAPRVIGAAWALALATVAIVLGGLGIIVTSALDLMRPLSIGQIRTGEPTPIAIVMLVFGSLTIFGVVALLVRLFGQVIAPRHHQQTPAAQISKAVTSGPLQLPAPPSAIGSITEHTTRNFDPRVYDELHARE